MAAHPAAPPGLPLVGQSQEHSWVEEGGEGGVEVLLQVLLQQALVREVLLEQKQSPPEKSAGRTRQRDRPPDQGVCAP